MPGVQTPHWAAPWAWNAARSAPAAPRRETLDGLDGAALDLADRRSGTRRPARRRSARCRRRNRRRRSRPWCRSGRARRAARDKPLQRRAVDARGSPLSVRVDAGGAIEHQSAPPASPREAASTPGASASAPRRADRRRWRGRRRSARGRQISAAIQRARPSRAGAPIKRRSAAADAVADRRAGADRDARRAIRRPRCRARGDHDDRDHEIAPRAELQERRTRRRRGRGIRTAVMNSSRASAVRRLPVRRRPSGNAANAARRNELDLGIASAAAERRRRRARRCRDCRRASRGSGSARRRSRAPPTCGRRRAAAGSARAISLQVVAAPMRKILDRRADLNAAQGGDRRETSTKSPFQRPIAGGGEHIRAPPRRRARVPRPRGSTHRQVRGRERVQATGPSSVGIVCMQMIMGNSIRCQGP